MPTPERFQWLRRDGAPLVMSLVLHALVLLALAPWLVLRTIPAPAPRVVEVMLEPARAARDTRHPDKAARSHVRPKVRAQRPKPVKLKPVEVAVERAVPEKSAARPQARDGAQGAAAGVALPGAGRAAAMPAEPALSAAGVAAATPAAAPAERALGLVAVGRTTTAPTPMTPSLGAAPQPSAQASRLPPRPGEDRQEGALNLTGSVPQSQAAAPEFRQAARAGGTQTLRGSSRTPEEGLARQAGNATELSAALAAPRPLTGAGAGSTPQRSMPAAAGAAVTGRASVPAGEAVAVVGRSAAADVPAGGGAHPGSAGTAAPAIAHPSAGHGGALPGEQGAGLVAASGAGAAPAGVAGRGPLGAGGGESGQGTGRAAAGSSGGAQGRDAAGLAASAEAGRGIAAGRDGAAPQFVAALDGRSATQAAREAAGGALQGAAASGTARVVEDRYAASALKVDSPRHVCDLPLMLAGFDRRPIPQGLDTINVSAQAALAGETPPRHLPGNALPRYPLEALPSRAAGRVVVRAEVLADGSIGHTLIKASSHFPVLDQAALATVRAWRFQPARRNGMPIAMWLDVPIEYQTP
jgi:TonB family protein